MLRTRNRFTALSCIQAWCKKGVKTFDWYKRLSANLHIPLSFFRDEYFLKTAQLKKASLNKESAKDTTVKAEYST
jgi:hypothetical protein